MHHSMLLTIQYNAQYAGAGYLFQLIKHQEMTFGHTAVTAYDRAGKKKMEKQFGEWFVVHSHCRSPSMTGAIKVNTADSGSYLSLEGAEVSDDLVSEIMEKDWPKLCLFIADNERSFTLQQSRMLNC